MSKISVYDSVFRADYRAPADTKKKPSRFYDRTASSVPISPNKLQKDGFPVNVIEVDNQEVYKTHNRECFASPPAQSFKSPQFHEKFRSDVPMQWSVMDDDMKNGRTMNSTMQTSYAWPKSEQGRLDATFGGEPGGSKHGMYRPRHSTAVAIFNECAEDNERRSPSALAATFTSEAAYSFQPPGVVYNKAETEHRNFSRVPLPGGQMNGTTLAAMRHPEAARETYLSMAAKDYLPPPASLKYKPHEHPNFFSQPDPIRMQTTEEDRNSDRYRTEFASTYSPPKARLVRVARYHRNYSNVPLAPAESYDYDGAHYNPAPPSPLRGPHPLVPARIIVVDTPDNSTSSPPTPKHHRRSSPKPKPEHSHHHHHPHPSRSKYPSTAPASMSRLGPTNKSTSPSRSRNLPRLP